FDVASMAVVTQIENQVRQELLLIRSPMGWVEPEFYGITVQARDLAEVTEADRVRVNRLVLAGILCILVLLIRRVWMSAYLLVTVLFSYFATLGATALVSALYAGNPLTLMDWRVPFFLFTILAAVGEDYNILLVTRILQERRRRGTVLGTQVGLAR